MMTVIFPHTWFRLKFLGLDINLKTIVAKNPKKKCKFAVAINAIFPQNKVLVKVAFFQKVQYVFQISKSPKKNIPKNYPELEI